MVRRAPTHVHVAEECRREPRQRQVVDIQGELPRITAPTLILQALDDGWRPFPTPSRSRSSSRTRGSSRSRAAITSSWPTSRHGPGSSTRCARSSSRIAAPACHCRCGRRGALREGAGGSSRSRGGQVERRDRRNSRTQRAYGRASPLERLRQARRDGEGGACRGRRGGPAPQPGSDQAVACVYPATGGGSTTSDWVAPRYRRIDAPS